MAQWGNFRAARYSSTMTVFLTLIFLSYSCHVGKVKPQSVSPDALRPTPSQKVKTPTLESWCVCVCLSMSSQCGTNFCFRRVKGVFFTTCNHVGSDFHVFPPQFFVLRKIPLVTHNECHRGHRGEPKYPVCYLQVFHRKHWKDFWF